MLRFAQGCFIIKEFLFNCFKGAFSGSIFIDFLVGWLEKVPRIFSQVLGFHGDESNGRIGNKITFNKQELETVKIGRLLGGSSHLVSG